MFDKKNVRVEEMYKVKIINIFLNQTTKHLLWGCFYFNRKAFMGLLTIFILYNPKCVSLMNDL
jgi:hypothetical protein